jgi:serine/threonine protein kinase
LIKRKRRLTEPEARFYIVEIVRGLKYIHAQNVIHRDLKLGNLMLDSEMGIKIGDFGLATKVDFQGQRKKTICGTPNYIAPEILTRSSNGHSFEVDVWSLGVVLYTLVVGKPPFQTKSARTTYRRIRENSYSFPSTPALSTDLKNIITAMLCTEPGR